MAGELSIEGLYQVVFTGIPVQGTDLATVKQNFRTQFKLSDKSMIKLFSGQNIAVQKDMTWEKATEYRDRLKEFGALCEILPMQEPGSGEDEIESFPCPKCGNLAKGERCTSCGFDLANYRQQMRVKGFIELAGTGYIKERREAERRTGDDRRDGVRFEDGRRVGGDRRKYKTGWNDN